MTRVWHYDGTSAIRHELTLVAQPGGISLRDEEGERAAHRWDEISFGGLIKNEPYYTIKGRRGWRMGFIDPIPAAAKAHLPRAAQYGGIIDRIGLGPASGVFLGLSALALFVALKVPDVLAPMVPLAWEKKLGDAMIGDFGGRTCHGPGSDAAIKAMMTRLDPGGKALDVQIANISMVNAIALPGGNIVIFRGLLQEAKSADELAGVLGHEIGHVRNRDVMQALIRQLGLSVVLGGASASAGKAGEYVNALLSSTYSREAEASADAFSIKLLRAATISPEDTASFFTRLAEDEKAMGKAAAAFGYVSSHPLSASREREFRASYVKGTAYRPVLTDAEWRAIVDSCANDSKIDKDDDQLF